MSVDNIPPLFVAQCLFMPLTLIVNVNTERNLKNVKNRLRWNNLFIFSTKRVAFKQKIYWMTEKGVAMPSMPLFQR